MRRAFKSAERKTFLSLIGWIFIFVATEPDLTAKPTGLPNNQSTAVTEALQASFGSVVQ